MALLIAPIMKFIILIFSPLVLIMNALTIAFQKITRTKELLVSVSREDVKAMVNIGTEEGSVDEQEKEMIEKVFLLNDITAEDVMTPDEYIVSFDTKTTLQEALSIIKESGYSRFPLFNKGGDVEGIVYVKDIFNYLAQVAFACTTEQQHSDNALQSRVTQFKRPAIFIPESMNIDDLMKDIQKNRKHIAIVVDEHGTVRGLVTLEDLLEEIVGEIIDETDVDDNLIKRIDENTIILDPRVTIAKVNDFFNSDLKASPQKTIGWLVLKKFGKIPQKGDSVLINDYNFTVDEADERRIKRLMMIKTAKAKLHNI